MRFDVLVYDHGGFHSYLCNDLEKEFYERFGAKPNGRGLYDSEAEARRYAEYANSDECGAEPGIWLLWQVMIYS